MAKKNKKGRKKFVVLLCIILILLTPFLTYALLIVALGLLPTMVASYTDTSKDMNAFKVVAACNAAGVLPIVADIHRSGITSDSVFSALADGNNWLIMYSAAALGWGFVWAYPKLVGFFLELSKRNQVGSLRVKQQQIVDEWGMDVEAEAKKTLRNQMFSEGKKRSKQ